MRNMQRVKQRKIVEISFDTESNDQFPNLSKPKNKIQARPTQQHKNQNDNSSPTSSQGDSLISAPSPEQNSSHLAKALAKW